MQGGRQSKPAGLPSGPFFCFVSFTMFSKSSSVIGIGETKPRLPTICPFIDLAVDSAGARTNLAGAA